MGLRMGYLQTRTTLPRLRDIGMSVISALETETWLV